MKLTASNLIPIFSKTNNKKGMFTQVLVWTIVKEEELGRVSSQ